MSAGYCRRCDVFVGAGAAGVAKPPEEHADDPAWLADHCWVCSRSSAEIDGTQAEAVQPEQPEAAPQPMVLEIAWSEGSIPRTEVFGPWMATDDFAHMGQIKDLLDGFMRVTGYEPKRVVLAIVQEPQQWLRQYEEDRRADQ